MMTAYTIQHGIAHVERFEFDQDLLKLFEKQEISEAFLDVGTAGISAALEQALVLHDRIQSQIGVPRPVVIGPIAICDFAYVEKRAPNFIRSTPLNYAAYCAHHER
jgi:hypothetical protein